MELKLCETCGNLSWQCSRVHRLAIKDRKWTVYMAELSADVLESLGP